MPEQIEVLLGVDTLGDPRNIILGGILFHKLSFIKSSNTQLI